MNYTKALLAAALAVLAVPAFSQTSNPAPVVNQRKENQQDRIANGIQSGQLTAGETKNLEKKEAGLNAEENRMRSRDNGNLTAADKARLTRQQNRLSKNIYRDKHNARVQNTNPKTEVGQRQRNQREERTADRQRNRAFRGPRSCHSQRSAERPRRQRRKAHPSRAQRGQSSADPHFQCDLPQEAQWPHAVGSCLCLISGPGESRGFLLSYGVTGAVARRGVKLRTV